MDGYNKKMMELMEWYMAKSGITQKEYMLRIGAAPNNISNYRKGIASFTVKQIQEACKLTNVSADWVLGLQKEMFRIKVKMTPIQKIEEALKELKTK